MQPRLTSSTKWTLFPKEYSEQMKSVLEESFKDFLSKGEFIVEGRIYREEILLRIGYLEKGRLRQVNFEASVQYAFNKDNVLQAINHCFDCCASMLSEYLQKTIEIESPIGSSSLGEDTPVEINLEDQMNLPYTWTVINFDDQDIHIQFSTVNTYLESQANELLGESSEFMVVGTDDEEHTTPDESEIQKNFQGFDEINKNQPLNEDDNLKSTTKDGRNLLH